MIFARFGLLLSIQLAIVMVSKASFTGEDFIHNYCWYYNNDTVNDKFVSNLDKVLPALLSSSDNGYGFFNASCCENDEENRAHALALCAPDARDEDCISCISYASKNLTEYCPNLKEAVTWYDTCMLHYSNNSINGILDDYPFFFSWTVGNISVPDVDVFYQLFITEVKMLSSQAAANGPLSKYAIGNVTDPNSNKTLYSVVQCTPDLSQADCRRCLTTILGDISARTYGSPSARLMRPSCSLRYQADSSFSNLTAIKALPPNSTISFAAPPPNPSTATVSGGNSKKQSNLSPSPIVIIVVVTIVIALLVLMASISVYLRVRKTKQKLKGQARDSETDALLFDFGSISAATNEFSESNKLGRGGFGAVYKGKLLDDENIAVKRLSKDSPQGDKEFKNEVELLVKLQHRNLVRLLGFCLEGNERLLIYEFVSNASLDHYIFDPIKREQLNWDIRYKIIVGIGRGLVYLHEDSRLRIIHRDLKASNVLLDEEMNPKIADFGMARLFNPDQTQGETSRIVGTYGYMAPEYLMHGHFSVKSDVYSFGVLILEIVCGKKNSSFRHGEKVEDLLSCAWKSWKEGTASNLIDPMLKTGSGAAMRCIHIGLLCVQQSIADRPTMAEVGQMLISNSVDLPVPSQPAFFMPGGIGSSSADTRSDQIDSNPFQNPTPEDSITELSPR